MGKTKKSITDLAGEQQSKRLAGAAQAAKRRRAIPAFIADESLDSLSLGVPPHQLEELGAARTRDGGYVLNGQYFTHEGAIRLSSRAQIREALRRDGAHRKSGVLGIGTLGVKRIHIGKKK